jgi:hypothetical protein
MFHEIGMGGDPEKDSGLLFGGPLGEPATHGMAAENSWFRRKLRITLLT